MAESKGYRVIVEKQILGGLGSVDVALERNGTAIACEICITTTVEHEVENIQKCLAAGFERVIAASSENKTLNKIKESAAAASSEEQFQRISFFTPEELLSFLDGIEAEGASKEETVRGYKVKVKYRATSASETKARKQAIAKTIVEAMRRMNR